MASMNRRDAKVGEMSQPRMHLREIPQIVLFHHTLKKHGVKLLNSATLSQIGCLIAEANARATSG